MPSPFKLPRFKKGERFIRAEDLNILVDAINAAQIMPGRGIRTKQTRAGTVIEAKKQTPGGGTFAWRSLKVSLTGGTDFPVLATMKTDIQGVYTTASLTPTNGDIIVSLPFHWLVIPTPTAGGSLSEESPARFKITVSSTDYWLIQIGPNRFFDFS